MKKQNKKVIVAINKIDLPQANPMRVKTDLLQQEVQVEEMGGDVQCVEISAKNKKRPYSILDILHTTIHPYILNILKGSR